MGHGSHVNLLLNKNYQTQLLSGKENFYIPMSITTELQQQVREQSPEESETDSQV